MRKYLYLIKKQKIKSWLKFWLLTNNKFNIILSNILEGSSFNLQNTVKRYFKIFNIFGNSVQDGTPSPENPVPINSVADDINLFDISNIVPTTVMTPNTNGGFKIQKVGNERISEEYPINIPANTNITISRVLKDYSNGSYIYCQWIATDNTTIWTPNIYADTVTTSFNKDIKGLKFYLQQTANDSDYVEIEKLKIQKGTVATPYSPYNYGTFTIDFEGQTENYNYTFITKPLRSLPNGVKDSLEDDGIHRKIGIQTGTLSQTTTITLSDAKQNGAYMCNIKSAGTLTGQTIELGAGDYEIIYELEEEIIEPYTEEQQAEYDKIKELYTFNGTTYISSDDEVPPYLQIQYYMKGE